MTLRRLAPLAAVAAGLLVAISPATDAATTVTYRLVNNSTGSAPLTQVVASVEPAGSVVAPSADVGPLAILAGSTGFDTNNLQVLLGDGTASDGSPLQALALDFGSSGFLGNGQGILNFSLNLDPNYKGGAPELVLPASLSSLTITKIVNSVPDPGTGGTPGGGTGGGTNGGGGGTPPPQVPEPATVVVWSILAAGGLWRVKSARARRDAA